MLPYIVLPYIKGVSKKISRVLKNESVKVNHKPINFINIFQDLNDSTRLQKKTSSLFLQFMKSLFLLRFSFVFFLIISTFSLQVEIGGLSIRNASLNYFGREENLVVNNKTERVFLSLDYRLIVTS